MFNNKTYGTAILRVRNADGSIAHETKPQGNLVFDAGLNSLANGCGFAGLFQYCKVGSGNTPVVVASGAVTFTQTGTTITASTNFFTSSMNGALLKYGSSGPSGAEVYLTYVDATHATASVSMTVTLPTAATVYMVQQTALQTWVATSGTYDSSGGANSTVFNNNVATMQRTFILSVPRIDLDDQ